MARGQRVNVAKQMMIAVRQMKCPQDKQQQKQKKAKRREREQKKKLIEIKITVDIFVCGPR